MFLECFPSHGMNLVLEKKIDKKEIKPLLDDGSPIDNLLLGKKIALVYEPATTANTAFYLKNALERLCSITLFKPNQLDDIPDNSRILQLLSHSSAIQDLLLNKFVNLLLLSWIDWGMAIPRITNKLKALTYGAILNSQISNR
jgi:hypothetical protein